MFKKTLIATAMITSTACMSVADSGNTDQNLSQLAFMNGCWVSSDDGSKEVWASEPGGMMFGYSVALADGAIVFFEQLRIAKTKAGVTYFASPEGQGPTPFELSEHSDSSALFVNPEHDFPQEIRYERDGDTLTATISATGGGNPMSFVKVRCT